MLTVRVSLILGDFLYDQHAVALRLRRTLLPALDRLEVVLPANVTLYARPGDDCRLEIDGGDGSGAVFSGRVSGIRRTLTAVRITAHNGGIALARYRPNLTLEQLSIGDVITSLCADSDVDIVANVEGAMLALYIAEGRATAAEEVARLARLAGAAGGFDGEGRLHVSEEGGRGGELALRYGREILACSVEENLADTNVLTVVGEGAGVVFGPVDAVGVGRTLDYH